MPEKPRLVTEKRQRKKLADEQTQLITHEITPFSDNEADDDEVFDHAKTSIVKRVFDAPNSDIEKLITKPTGKYTFLHSIGHGGMKSILKVRDNSSTRDIAMAVLRDPNSNKSNIGRFIQEARITANLEHPNIIPIHDIGVDGLGNPYFTMKMIEGESLSSIIDNLAAGDPDYVQKYDLTSLLLVFRKICQAIAFAHSKGIIHLDLTPENIQVGDYGQVLVLDWGLAKFVERDELEGSSRTDLGIQPMSRSVDVTLDGEIKGTPGYMAPEQAAGKNRDKDERTDIYALGMILYAILTWESPIDSDSVEDVLEKTIAGDIPTPRERSMRRSIPAAVEAIVLKAMALDPEDRYQRVSELRRDIDAFISGFATTAERASLLKRTLLLVKRHRMFFSFLGILLVILIGVGRYALYEGSLRVGDWVRIYERDFTTSNDLAGGMTFMDRANTRQTSPWTCDWRGVKMPKYEWLWLKNARLRDNFRISIQMVCDDKLDALEVCVNSKPEPLKKWWEFPGGYSFKFGAYNGAKDLITKKDETQNREILNSRESKIKATSLHTITISRKGEKIEVLVDDELTFQIIDYFPPLGKDLDWVGIRSFSPSMRLLTLQVQRQALPEKASPLIAGDALVESGHYQDAIKKYLTIAENYDTSSIGEQAYAKAYSTASTKIHDNAALLLDIKKRISYKFPNFKYRDRILELDAMVLWRQGKYDEALKMLPQIFKISPSTLVAARLIQYQNEPLPSDICARLLEWVGKTSNLKRLSLANLGVKDLRPITQLHLLELDCSNNPILDITPLGAMPLKILDLSRCKKLRNIEALKEMKTLEKLIIPKHFKDYPVLKGLENVHISFQ